ncbi:DUF3995 domain-containing protein [Kitasatospora sp. NPDC004240]
MNAMTWLLGEPGAGAGQERGGGGTDPWGGPALDRAVAWLAASVLLAAGAFHLLWVFSPWPLDTRADFAETVVGVPESELPSGPLTLAVAALLGAAAWLVVTASTPGRRLAASRLVRAGLWTVTGVLAVRGVGGLVGSALDLADAPDAYRYWDLTLYAPLCASLAALTGFLALRTRRR